jgi:AcrR family transcriptional regulator
MARVKKPTAERGLSTAEWLELAKSTLIKEGIGGVKIDRLAKMGGVTRGGFYYRFKGLQGLLDELLEHWRATNHQPIIDALTGPGAPAKRFRALVHLWLEEREYDPDYDTAIRAWSRVSPKVAAVVHEIDDLRIEALKQLFLDAGYDDDEAFIRARITYFHQVGYYAMGLKESAKRREELSELYYRVLTGFRAAELRQLPVRETPQPPVKPSRRRRSASTATA